MVRKLGGIAVAALAAAVLAACSSLPPPSTPTAVSPQAKAKTSQAERSASWKDSFQRHAYSHPPSRVDPAQILSGDWKTVPEDPAPFSTAELAASALDQLGVRYRLGGTSPEAGFDCSGLVVYVTREVLGLQLPRRAEEISRVSEPIDVDDLQPGDLVFYNTLRRKFSHVGIYLGDGRFVHSPSSGGVVRIESMDISYWKKRFNGARRIASNESPAP